MELKLNERYLDMQYSHFHKTRPRVSLQQFYFGLSISPSSREVSTYVFLGLAAAYIWVPASPRDTSDTCQSPNVILPHFSRAVALTLPSEAWQRLFNGAVQMPRRVLQVLEDLVWTTIKQVKEMKVIAGKDLGKKMCKSDKFIFYPDMFNHFPW